MVVPSNGSLANVMVSPATVLRLRRILEKDRFDLLHLHEPAMPFPCAAALALGQAPLVGTFHASGILPLLELAKFLYGPLIDRRDPRFSRCAGQKTPTGFRRQTRGNPSMKEID
ncbi:MAG: glycosyltransferase family 4 protein [Actinobacteria bacterium]|nr:glycosyltransferase family 4 protein [Actinomycetota bacterium]